MWVYETEVFKRGVEEYGLADVVRSKTERIIGADTRAQASRIFRPYAGYLTSRHENLRLIGGVEKVGDQEVFCWYTVLKRGDAEYREFTKYAVSELPKLLDRSELAAWLDEQKNLDAQRRRPAPLPDLALPWLEPMVEIFASVAGDDEVIYETAEWVTGISETEQYRWSELHAEVAALDHVIPESDTGRVVVKRNASRFGVAAQRTEAKALFLLAVVRPDQPDSHFEGLKPPQGGDALRHARRAYPMWLLAESELWFEVQKDGPLNLALSPEEQELLKLVGGQAAEGSGLPMFVNGQAGSGKSTMLAYIFAGLCKRKHDRGLHGSPLFVTYSERLLLAAERTTRRILDAHPDTGRIYADVDLAGLFTSWRDYLLRMLPDDERDRFNESKRVDYHDFKMAWDGFKGKLPAPHFPREGKPAELVWYVIRSLIKGSDLNGDLKPEDFDSELTKLERTVSYEVYENIFSNFYKPWYKRQLEELGLWDDQDLVEAVLTSLQNAVPVHEIAALVVDEAQDFTRRELRLITRTTLYTNYEIPDMGIGIRPPIIFAGDPMQTLSPTGFRWNAVKAGIHEELKGLFGSDARTPTFRELRNNYRSSQPIVQLANSIQLWRKVLFGGYDDLKPQEAWRPTHDHGAPEKFYLDEIESDFTEFARETIIIVPCEEGGEVSYVKADPLLSKMFPDASEVNPPDTVFSAAGVKGLEFAKVILYKFGLSDGPASWTLGAQREEMERDLTGEYFFNKLYVAATRARDTLYIVDTVEGDTNLWSHFSVDAIPQLQTAATSMQDTAFGRESLGSVEYGGQDIQGVREENPRENAVATRDYARETRNPRKMRQAASFYRRANERQAADECEAWALQFEGDLQAAGAKFEAATKYLEAWSCYWDLELWTALGNIATKVPAAPALQREAVRFMDTPNPVEADITGFARTILAAHERPRASTPGWSKVVARLVQSTVNERASMSDDGSSLLAETLLVLLQSGFVDAGEAAAQAFLKIGNSAQAKQILGGINSPMTIQRARVLSGLEGLPSGLKYLQQVNEHREVVDEWAKAGRPVTDEWVDVVLVSLAGDSNSETRLRLLLDAQRVESAAEFFVGRRWPVASMSFALEICGDLGRNGSFAEGMDFVESVVEMRSGRFKRSDFLAALVGPLAEYFESRNWAIQPVSEQKKVRGAAEMLYEKWEFKHVQLSSVPAFGAVLETAGMIRKAKNLYTRFAECDDAQLRQYCRRRALATATEELKSLEPRGEARREVQDQQHRNSKAWGIPLDAADIPLVARLKNDRETAGVVSNGSHGPVKWTFTHPDKSFDIDFDDGKTLARAKLDLKGGKHRVVGADWTLNDDVTTVSIGDDVKIIVSSDDELTLTIRTGEESFGPITVADLAAFEVVSPLSPRPTSRTTPRRTRPAPSADHVPLHVQAANEVSGKSIQAHLLAKELRLTLAELMRLAENTDMRRRRGNDRFTPDEAATLRFHASVPRAVSGVSFPSLDAED